MLHIHRAERADGLVEALADVLADPLDDPMEPEVVSVPTRGVERWVSQCLAAGLGASPGRADGVCANVEFPFPGTVVGEAVAAASGVDRDTDPWLPERSVWPLLEVVDQCLGEPWLASLAAHLELSTGPEAGGGRRFTSLRHIADLYDRYSVHRPEMLQNWAAGRDADAAGRSLADDALWQAELWRRLRLHIATPSPAERLAGACAVLRSDPAISGLPRRVSLFGLTRLPVSYLQVLRAVADGRHVHLFLLHPSPELWGRVAKDTAGRPPGSVPRRTDDPTTALATNPLLASWGRDAREMQLVLGAGTDANEAHDHRPVPAIPPTTLLHRIQADVRADRSPPGLPMGDDEDGRPVLDPDDRSLQVHACHGRARQVEVVRDAILHTLAEDLTLEARDVIVMCPDIEAFAPLIHATFGAGETDDGEPDASGGPGGPSGPLSGVTELLPAELRPPDLRVRLADRSLRQTNAVLGVVSELLALADARLTATQVLDLAGREPVRRRFHLDDDDLARLEEWVSATGVRWGFDAGHRAPFQLQDVGANTWRAGLDRVLLGVAMAESGQRLLGGVLPLDDVDSSAIELAGRLAELVDRLETCLDSLKGPHSMASWVAAISAGADALTATTEGNAWQRTQLQRLLDEAEGEAAAHDRPVGPDLHLPEVRGLLADRLRGRPTRANFRTGHLTICTLVPMRSVPHRVVCLLGLDDGVFPRKTTRDGDDLVLDNPHVGDRDARSEDRQLLLDALLAATDRLVITYTGRDERTNAARPPAVPVGELLDVVDNTVGQRDGVEARHRIVVHHPLHPFDVRNFTPGELVPGRAWSFDPVALAGAQALAAPRISIRPFLAGPLPVATGPVVEVDQLVRFVQHPVKAFLRQRLGISVSDYSEEVGDSLPVELDALEQWGVGQRLLDARLGGENEPACVAAEIARGILPPGALALPTLDAVAPTVQRLVDAALARTTEATENASAEVNVGLPDGRMLVGTVPGIIGRQLRAVTYSRVGPKHRLAAWVRFLALTASHPDVEFETLTIGRVRFGARGQVTVARLPAFAGPASARQALAVSHLATLVDVYDRGIREPLPLYCASSAAYAQATADGKNPDGPARTEWESGDRFPKEDKNLEHTLVLGGIRTFAEVSQAPARPDEGAAGWATTEPTRFGRYARRLWDDLLAWEEVVDQ